MSVMLNCCRGITGDDGLSGPFYVEAALPNKWAFLCRFQVDTRLAWQRRFKNHLNNI